MRPPLGERLAMLTLEQGELARMANVSQHVISRILRGHHRRRPHPSTMTAIDQALSAHEIKVRDYLIAIHGPGQGEGA